MIHIRLLKEAYERIQQKNPSFSLNSYARYLNLSPSHLNEIMSEETGLSLTKALEIAKRINLSQNESEVFLLSVKAHHSRSKIDKEKAATDLKRLLASPTFILQTESFKSLANWYHSAILEAMNLHDFEAKPSWFAKKLNLPNAIVKAAISRLKQLNLIQVNGKNWSRHEGTIEIRPNDADKAVQQHHAQALARAESSLQNVPVHLREFNTMTLAIDEELVSYASKRVRDFQKELLSELLARSSKRNSVYVFTNHFFPVTAQSIREDQ